MSGLNRINAPLILAILSAIIFKIDTGHAASNIPWKKLPGQATDIGVGANGAAWIAGTDGAAWNWNGKTWVKIGGGSITRIATDPKSGIWAIANGTQIWRFDGAKWRHLPGQATDIGIGANGAVWIVGTDTAPYRWNDKKWIRVGGGDLVRVAVDPNGNAWVVNKSNVIFRYTSQGFKQLPGRGTDVGVGADGSVWIVGTDGAPYRWNGKNWQKHTGGIAQIAVGPKGYPWAANDGKEIYVDSRSLKASSTRPSGTSSGCNRPGDDRGSARNQFSGNCRK